VATTQAQRHTVVGVFHDEERAREAAHRLDQAGFPPADVGVVAGNVRQAREAAGAFSMRGAIAGALIGFGVGVAFVLFGGPTMRDAGLAGVFGALLLAIPGFAVGALAGRARIFKAREYAKLERAVERGDALVTIVCEHDQCVRAEDVMRRAGATAVRDEDTAESV
jgi:hypothetical protein